MVLTKGTYCYTFTTYTAEEESNTPLASANPFYCREETADVADFSISDDEMLQIVVDMLAVEEAKEDQVYMNELTNLIITMFNDRTMKVMKTLLLMVIT